jgi:hypothetical protein
VLKSSCTSPASSGLYWTLRFLAIARQSTVFLYPIALVFWHNFHEYRLKLYGHIATAFSDHSKWWSF